MKHFSPLRVLCFGLMIVLCSSELLQAAPPKLPHVEPESVGMSRRRLDLIDAIVAEGLQREEMCGCVVLIGRRCGIVFEKAYGDRQVLPERDPMTVDTVFDLASLTKPIATGTSLMTLVEEGKLQLDDPVAKYIPEFAVNGKEAITVRQLLTHQAGLIPDTDIEEYRNGSEEAIRKALATTPTDPPGTKFVYSDVGPIIVAELIRRLTGDDIHAYSRKRIYQPLGMLETGYNPGPDLLTRAIVTEQREGRWMKGEVHDPRAYLMNGIAGHAGLFSTAEDLAVYAAMMLGNGEYCGVRILAPETVKLMTTPEETSQGLRSISWDSKSSYSSNRGDLCTPQAFGHGGFTGTVIWIDPGLDLFYIFLSSRLHPDGKGTVNPLAGRIGTVAASAIRE